MVCLMKNVPQYDCPLVPFLERNPYATLKIGMMTTFVQKCLVYRNTSKCIKISFRGLYILLFQIYIYLSILILSLNALFT